MKEAIIEALKEMLRVAVLAVIPVAVDGLSKGQVDLRLIAITAVIAGLRFIDKVLHEVGKSSDNESLSKGLTRF